VGTAPARLNLSVGLVVWESTPVIYRPFSPTKSGASHDDHQDGRHGVEVSVGERVHRGPRSRGRRRSAVRRCPSGAVFRGLRRHLVVGPAFLLNAVGGLAIGLAVLVWRSWLPLLAAIGFGIATLVAFYLSATIGFFGVHETWGGNQQIVAEVAEWAAVVGAAAAGVFERRKS